MKKLLICFIALMLFIMPACNMEDNSDDMTDDMPDDVTDDMNPDATNDSTKEDADDSGISANDTKDETLGIYKDGIYIARQEISQDGFRDYVKVEISDGKIISVEYEGENDDGDKKTTDEDYINSLGENAVLPSDYMPGYVDRYMTNYDLNEVTPIEGAEDAHTTFTALLDEALKNARDGSTKEATVNV